MKVGLENAANRPFNDWTQAHWANDQCYAIWITADSEIKKADSVFIETAVDFIKTYADRCHHGKEEDILFRELKGKNVSDEHKQIMDQLVEDHKWGRKTTARLVEANESYRKGDESSLSTITECMRLLVEFYPKHIEIEDKRFFIPVMEYFSKNEQDAMLKEGYEFDKKLIHETYQNIVKRFEEV